jgi:predicted metal-dependent hydrolase
MTTLQKQKDYVNTLAVTTLKQCRRIKSVTIKFRNGKYKTAASTLEYETSHPTIIFSIYWVSRLARNELRNLVLHECAHVIAKDGHTKKFRSTCCKIGVAKKWQRAYTDDVEVIDDK